MGKDKAKKDKLPPILEGPVSPLGIRRDYDSGEVRSDMIKEINLNNPPPIPAPVVKVPVDYDAPCSDCSSPILEETYGEGGNVISISICPVSKSASSKDVKYLVDHIKGYLKVGNILTWDVIQDICVSLDQICDQTKKLKKQEKD